MSLVSTRDRHPTSKIKLRALVRSLCSSLDELFETFVVDVGGCPFRDLVARQIASKLHGAAGSDAKFVACKHD
jgi:hypothetical protein